MPGLVSTWASQLSFILRNALRETVCITTPTAKVVIPSDTASRPTCVDVHAEMPRRSKVGESTSIRITIQSRE